MDYLDDVIFFIEENLIELDIVKHGLAEMFCVSDSKLQKDFKNKKAVTLRTYIRDKKIERAYYISQRESGISKRDLKERVNYCYCLRSFRDKLKEFNPDTCSSTKLAENYFHHNSGVFAEIFVRLIIHFNLESPKFDERGIIQIEHNVKNTIFQFSQFFLDEIKHHYQILYDLSSDSLCYFLYTQSKFGEQHVRFYQTINHYFDFLYHINIELEEKIGYSLTSAIEDWDDYVKSISTLTVFTRTEYKLDVDLSNRGKIKLNQNSEFIQNTNHIIQNFKSKLKKQMIDDIESQFSMKFEDLNQYLKYAQDLNYLDMKAFLNKIPFQTIQEIDIWLTITEFPYLEYFDNAEDELTFSVPILNTLQEFSHEKIIKVIIDFKRKIEKLDDDYVDYELEEVLRETIQNVWIY